MKSNHALEWASAPPRASVPSIQLYVIYTTPDATRTSLLTANVLARDLGANIELLVPKVVRYPLSLDTPSTATDFTENAAFGLVHDCGIDAEVNVLLCRGREETIARWLPADAIAVVGRHRSWGAGSARGLKFYIGGIAEQAIGKPAAWMVLGVMHFNFGVRLLCPKVTLSLCRNMAVS